MIYQKIMKKTVNNLILLVFLAIIVFLTGAGILTMKTAELVKKTAKMERVLDRGNIPEELMFFLD